MKKLKQWLRARREKRHQDALSRGYGWAWAAYRVERRSVMEIDAYLDLPFEQTQPGKDFDLGAQMAIEDIRQFQRSVRGKGE